MGNFLQLGLDFEMQENNWLRWARGRDYLPQSYTCITARLIHSMVQSRFAIDGDSQAEIAKLDALEFEKLVIWLPAAFRSVYLAHNLNKVLKGKTFKFAKSDDIVHKRNLLGISKYQYEADLSRAIHLLKRHGGLL